MPGRWRHPLEMFCWDIVEGESMMLPSFAFLWISFAETAFSQHRVYDFPHRWQFTNKTLSHLPFIWIRPRMVTSKKLREIMCIYSACSEYSRPQIKLTSNSKLRFECRAFCQRIFQGKFRDGLESDQSTFVLSISATVIIPSRTSFKKWIAGAAYSPSSQCRVLSLD